MIHLVGGLRIRFERAVTSDVDFVRKALLAASPQHAMPGAEQLRM